MMKHRTIFYLTILLASIIHLQSSCLKNNSEPKPKELPPITTEGRNTIGFLLNGEVWLPGGGGIGRPDKDFVLDTFSNMFSIKTYFDSRNNEYNHQSFVLRMYWPNGDCQLGSMEYYQPSDLVIAIDYRFLQTSDHCIDFKKLLSSKINIIFCDIDKQIISGTFELTIENECGDVYEITDGRFDAQFRYF